MKNMKIQSRSAIGVTLIEIEGSIDHPSADQLNRALQALLAEGASRLLMDLGKVDYISSAGLRALVNALKAARSQNGDLRMIGVLRSVKEIFELSGFARIFPVYDNRSLALSDFGLDIAEEVLSHARVFRLRGNLDRSVSTLLNPWLEKIAAETALPIILDLEEVEYSAAECLRALGETTGRLRRRGLDLGMINVRETIHEAIEVCGLGLSLRTYSSLKDASKAIFVPAKEKSGNSGLK
jgi:anti-anti-sigma factor